MEKKTLVSIADIEKLNASELNNVKGGTCSIAQDSPAEDSEHHDSNNNDTFKGNENTRLNP
ncbi:hypothetical protein [uncultured Prevotella sp.]|uniref:hypothetical protein n=1 Tax=uncultured Prevotella sp. TaxID=159272 RepID=UPI00266B9DA8|nr:hypothetical protein [uncultured Prevotella sp.]